MKTVAVGGVMIAVFVVIGLVFNVNVRAVQTYVEILKTAIIAVCIRKFIPPKNSAVFLVACFLVCLILLPVHHAIIYNVPSLIGGYVIGRKREKYQIIRDYFPFFFVNTLMIAYKYLIYNLLMNTNLFLAYREGFSSVFSDVLGINISPAILNYVFILSLVADSAISSIIIYTISIFVIKQVDKVIK